MKFLVTAIALSVLILTGCKSSEETKLTFILSGEASQVTKAIECRGDLDCKEIFKVPEKTWDPIPGNTACTQMWGGPERLTVSGTIRGKQITSSFSRNNGCEINRWNEISPLLEKIFGKDLKRGIYASLLLQDL